MNGVTTPPSSHYYKTWTEAAGLPEITAALDRLPPGLDFPDDFPEPIRFDPVRRLLVYRGFMTSVSYRFLHGLSPDSEYIVALDDLFQASSYTLEKRSNLARVWPWLVGASMALGGMVFAWTRLQ
jgi:hypothetical protein